MTVFLEKTEYLYQTEKVIRLFLPFEKIVFNQEKDESGRYVFSGLQQDLAVYGIDRR